MAGTSSQKPLEGVRAARLLWLTLGAFLVLTPLTLHKPGLPGGLKADEAAYLMMAGSLAFDRDLEVDERDTQRLFDEYPLRWTRNVIVFSDDGGETVHYAKPFVHPLIAAPFVRLFGSNGMLALNQLMLWLMIGMGAHRLAQRNAPVLALLFSAGFFLLSACWSYAFWLQPEIFNLFGVCLALWVALPPIREGDEELAPLAAPWRLAVSGAALALAVYNKPMLLALALPVVGAATLERLPFALRPGALRSAGAWAAGFTGCVLALVGLSQMLIGHPTAYGVPGRQGISVCEPGPVPIPEHWRQAGTSTIELGPVAAGQSAVDVAQGESADDSADEGAEPSADNRSFYWLARVPEWDPGRWIANLTYFFVGRHTGLVHYFPFAFLALLLFLAERSRDLARWLTLAGTVVVGAYFLLWIGWNWQGGGGFIGNRYFVNVVPALLFLVGRIRAPWTLVAAAAWSALTIGQLILSPFGVTVPEPTLQAHTRNWPLRAFPLELTLKNVPGYHRDNAGGLRTIVREDRAVPRGGGYWTTGRGTTEMLVLAPERLERTTVQVRGVAPSSTVTVRLGDAEETLQLTDNETRTIELQPLEGDRRYGVVGKALWAYPFEVTSDQGVLQHWTRAFPPTPCNEVFRFDSTVSEAFWTGAEVRLLGPTEQLQRDLYAVEFHRADLPETLAAGRVAKIPVSFSNRSEHTWSQLGAAQIFLSYHWLDADGQPVAADARRVVVPAMAPGETTAVRAEVQAPRRPGDYVLEFDLVHEYVAWFAERNGGRTLRLPVTVQ